MNTKNKLKSVSIILLIALSTLLLAGVVEAQSCSDECSPFGSGRCVSSTSYETCAQYDSDNCLEWGNRGTCQDLYGCTIDQTGRAGCSYVGCSSNAQCQSGQYCRFARCWPYKQLGQACQVSLECAQGGCYSGVCALTPPPANPGPSLGCSSDSDCSPSEVCSQEGQCVVQGNDPFLTVIIDDPAPDQGAPEYIGIPDMRCGCVSNRDCQSGESCSSNGICEPDTLDEGEENPDPDLENTACEEPFIDDEDNDNDGVTCDLCPSTNPCTDNTQPCPEALETNGCVADEDGNIEPEFPVGTCRDLGGVACQAGETCENGIEISLGDQSGCCIPRDANNDGVADQPSACSSEVFSPVFGGSVTITRSQCIDEDGDGQGTKDISINQALPQGVQMSDIAPECPPGVFDQNCQAPCSTIPQGGDRQIVSFYTLTGALLSLGLVTGFYFMRRRKKRKL